MVKKIDSVLTKDCEETLPIIKQDFETKIQGIENDIEEYSSHLETNIENWINTNLTYVYENIKCMYIFPNDNIAKVIVESLMTRQQYLEKKFCRLQSQNSKIKTELSPPINVKSIIYVKENLFPLVAEISILRDQILLITKKYYKF